MVGAIIGDIIGSVHEFWGRKTKDFPLFVEDSRFTDDTVLSIAVADCLLTGTATWMPSTRMPKNILAEDTAWDSTVG